MHVADEDDVDLTQPRIVRSGDGATSVVEYARAVRILEDQGSVLRAKLAVLTAERRHLYIGRQGYLRNQCGHAADKCHPDHRIRPHAVSPYGFKSPPAGARLSDELASFKTSHNGATHSDPLDRRFDSSLGFR